METNAGRAGLANGCRKLPTVDELMKSNVSHA